VLIDNVPSPNGIALNKSEKVVFVAATCSCEIWILPMTDKGGVGIAIDYVVSHPERLLSMVLANGTGLSQGTGGVRDAEYMQLLANVRTKGFDDMPVEFRELSPSYRAINPEGVRLWLELHRRAVTGNRIGQKPANELTWAALRGMKVPTLLITGDASASVAGAVRPKYSK
jgi:pimeloyl-ACP methyl ester carboxylesterase